MEKKAFNQEFYVSLYEDLCKQAGENYDSCGNDSEDSFEGGYRYFTSSYELETGRFTVYLDATFIELFVDDSFDHAFGTEHAWHTELGEFESISDITVYDNDTDEDVTSQFSEADFMEQFKVYETKVGGKVIKAGDSVLVCTSRPYIASSWRDGVYLYTDTRSGHHCCRVEGWRTARQFLHIKAKTA